jgi:xanthine dehydrogenase iron-sulfur cluster and FAD-binding subunit A
MKLDINGGAVTAPKKLQDVTLLNFLRDFAGLTGTKLAAGSGYVGPVLCILTRVCRNGGRPSSGQVFSKDDLKPRRIVGLLRSVNS